MISKLIWLTKWFSRREEETNIFDNNNDENMRYELYLNDETYGTASYEVTVDGEDENYRKVINNVPLWFKKDYVPPTPEPDPEAEVELSGDGDYDEEGTYILTIVQNTESVIDFAITPENAAISGNISGSHPDIEITINNQDDIIIINVDQVAVPGEYTVTLTTTIDGNDNTTFNIRIIVIEDEG